MADNNAETKEDEIPKPLEILIVGADKGIVSLIVDHLNDGGIFCHINTYSRAKEALDVLIKAKESNSFFDWVIIDPDWVKKDWRLEGGIDGFKLAEGIRDGELGNPYVTMLRGNTMDISGDNSPQQLKKKGIHSLIDKSFSLKQLPGLVDVVRGFRRQSSVPQKR